MSGFVPLHVHTYYSTLDSSASPEEYMARAKELGLTHLSISDHGTTSGHRHFQRAAKDAGIIPILGLEAYYTDDMHDRRAKAKRQDGTQVYNHLSLIAKDETGLDNLNYINKIAWQEGFYHKPRIGKDLLFENSEGLIVLSGCMSGMISKALMEGNDERAYAIAREHKEALGDDFYIEVMASNDLTEDGKGLNHKLLRLADKLKIKPVMSSDCHYVRKEDLPLEEALLILSTNPKKRVGVNYEKARTMDLLDRYNYLYPDRRMTFQEIEVYLRDHQTEKELFVKQGIERDDIFANTLEIASKVGEYPYHENLDMLPRPKGDPKKMLEDLAYQGLKDLGVDTQEYRDRIAEELQVIFDKGFESYFLVMRRIVQWTREQGIRSGYGRGSGAGSLVNYSLGLTQIDPIKYNLLFFRFLDPSRPDWPDLDFDVSDSRREEVKDFIRQSFNSVAGISTIQFFQGKSSIRDASRALGVPLKDVDRALKNNDASLAMNESFEYYDWFIKTEQGAKFNKAHPEAVELARKLYGRLKSFGQHASAIVASKEPIERYMPIQSARRPGSDTERVDVIGLDMKEVEEMGFIKLDILGLKALSIVEDTLNYIKDRHGVDIDMNALPLDDADVYEQISQGRTSGIFQLEQFAYTHLIMQMGGVRTFDELAASNALVRPGAAKSIGPDYIARKNGQEPTVYMHKNIRYFTEDTYGLPTLYQEQQMLVCVELGGMTMEEANKVRRGLGKKEIDKIAPFKDKFITNATEFIGQEKAEKLWSDLEFGAEYNFNKSHSVAYSMLSYATAWLKYHYPVEFMAATIRNEDDKDSLTDYLTEARRLGIRIKLPHVNKSMLKAEPEGEDSIRLGLTNIKFCGPKVAQKVILHRPYDNYEHLKSKVEERGSGMNKRMLNAMNLVGAAYFKDNPRRGDEREHFYNILQIPAFSTQTLDPVVRHNLMDIDDVDEKGVFIFAGLLRNVHQGDGWARGEFIDETGACMLFMDSDNVPPTDEEYVVLGSGPAAMRVVSSKIINSGSKNSFVRFLYGELPELAPGHHMTLAWRERKTRKGDKMANMVAVNHIGEVYDILVWPTDFETANQACKVGMTWNFPLREKEDEDGAPQYFLNVNNGRRNFARTARNDG